MLMLILAFCLIGFSAGREEKKPCNCYPPFNECTKEKGEYNDECYYLDMVCERKCEGLDIKQTLEQYRCEHSGCSTIAKECGMIDEFSQEMKKHQCLLKLENCKRACNGKQHITMDKFKEAKTTCDRKFRECYVGGGDSWYVCGDLAEKCEEDIINVKPE